MPFEGDGSFDVKLFNQAKNYRRSVEAWCKRHNLSYNKTQAVVRKKVMKKFPSMGY